MANAINWATTLTSRAALTTELNSLATNTRTAAGPAIDNSSNLDVYGWLEFLGTWGTNPSANAYIVIYMMPSADGTNYADGSNTVNPGADAAIATIPILASTSAQRKIVGPIMLPPGKLKFIVESQTGQTLAASGNTLTLWTNNLEIQ